MRVLPFKRASAPRPEATSQRRSCQLCLPDGASQRHFCHQSLPDGTPGQQHLPDGSSPQRHSRQQLRHGVPASNKPHPEEKSTSVWLAIWCIWAGFANSQHRDAAFATPDNICAHSSLLITTLGCCSDIANLSAHLHRLPTPPPYLRQMRLLHGPVRRCWVLDEAVASQRRRYWMTNAAAACPGRRYWVANDDAAWPGAAFLQITARTNPCSRHLWGTLARAVASICAHRASC